MHNFSFIKRAFYTYQGIMLWLIHWSDTRKLLGVRISSLIKFISLLVPLAFWTGEWVRSYIILGLILFLWVQISYWRAHRLGYYRFVENETDLLTIDNPEPLPKKKRIKVNASGVFSLKDWEKNVVLRPAEYWQVPLGDHALMVEQEPGRYLYQFFNASSMQELKHGWILFGARPHPALAVTFLSSWGPEFNEDNISLVRKNNNNSPKIRAIYLSFSNDEEEQAVWQNMVFDARRVRSGLKN